MSTAQLDLDSATQAASQKLLMEAGYEPKDDWLYIDDLVDQIRSTNAGQADLLQQVDHYLATTAAPSRRAFKIFCRTLYQQDADRQRAEKLAEGMARVYASAGVAEPDAGHKALALRISELELAVQGYAARLRKAEEAAADSAAKEKSSGTLPFLAGVMIGGTLF
ncbi:hypothetical protein [Variovorax ginsengisoli]|uniref:Uncharacterized protein n=1 Tax=Variovorax ginsengisoli TaxID=363844 RepID=A0ABT8SFQ9_9BURK|nr:hypothetical protein [Variovorax ginsengisoli]MDN8617146.1 hypothetical protein [Variovorax ginsengisoli]MDO1536316.1 hypothetical protein [Variovorax ginsengisoli]